MAKRQRGAHGETKSVEHKQKISESLKNNTNAEYWTEDLVMNTLKEMIIFLQTDVVTNVSTKTEVFSTSPKKKQFEDDEEDFLDEIQAINNTRVITQTIATRPQLKKEARLHFMIFNPSWFDDMAKKFSENPTVSYLLKAIDDICEINTYNPASKGITNPIMAKANLAKHYDWKDKTESNSTNLSL